MHLSDHCSACDQLRFVRPRATSQRNVMIVHLRNWTSGQLKLWEIQVATTTNLTIKKLQDNDNASLFCGWCLFLLVYPLWQQGPRLLVHAAMLGIVFLGNHEMVPIFWPHWNPHWSSFEHFGMNLTKGYLGDDTLIKTPQNAKWLDKILE